MHITHKIGNPNVGLHVSIKNGGGRELRIRSIGIHISRDGKQLTSMPAQNYFEKINDPTSTLFVPFSLKHNEYWSHIVNFLNTFDRSTEKLYRESERELKKHINEKLNAMGEENKKPVKADEALVEPFTKLFERLFIWEPGEYIVELTVITEPKSAMYAKKYRFTIYESDTDELKKYVTDYPYGAGIYYNSETHTGIAAPLSEHLG